MNFFLGRITEESSLFTYDGGRDFSSYQNHDFQPMFDVPNITEEAIDTCGYNTDCLFDLSVTKDREFAMLSANASETFADVTDEVDNYGNENTVQKFSNANILEVRIIKNVMV